jgi:hypothetical protein
MPTDAVVLNTSAHLSIRDPGSQRFCKGRDSAGEVTPSTTLVTCRSGATCNLVSFQALHKYPNRLGNRSETCIKASQTAIGISSLYEPMTPRRFKYLFLAVRGHKDGASPRGRALSGTMAYDGRKKDGLRVYGRRRRQFEIRAKSRRGR